MSAIADFFSSLFFVNNEYKEIEDQITGENIYRLNIFSIIAMIAFATMRVMSFMEKIVSNNGFVYLGYLIVDFCIFISLRFLTEKNKRIVSFLVHFFIFHLLVFGIILGTIISPQLITVSFIAMLFAATLIFVLPPLNVNLIIIGSVVLYFLIARKTQSDEIFSYNRVNVVCFGAVSLLVASFTMKIKIQSLFYEYENKMLKISDKANAEKHKAYESFITKMLRNASLECEPDEVINRLLQFICTETGSDRAYIFESNNDGTFDNTYEYCREGVVPQIDVLQNVPYDNVLSVWFDQYRRSHNILIYNLEEYRKVSEPIYNILKPQNINTLVTGPISFGGKNIGLYGVDNPPAEKMDTISELLGMIEFVFSMMLRLRDNARSIQKSAELDQLTDCKNRKALNWAYEKRFNENKPFGICMCDINGLKTVNDKQGHDAGDKFIIRTAEIFKDICGKENVYRLGGDEFAAVLPGISKEDMEQKKQLLELQLGNTASVGIVWREKMEISFEELLNTADRLMYEQKDAFYERQKV